MTPQGGQDFLFLKPGRMMVSSAGKYVQCAILQMLERLSGQGAARGALQAKLFGGSDMFDPQGSLRSVGKQNMEMALRILERESVSVVRQDLGGGRGRKIIFHTHRGSLSEEAR